MTHSKLKVPFRTDLARNIFSNKYALTPEQTWYEKSRTIVEDVCGTGCHNQFSHPLMSKEERRQLTEYISEMKFLPGGRYIYYAGRPNRFWNNCLLLKGEDDTREEWSALTFRAMSALMSGAGIGIDYSVFRPQGRILSKTGGEASGPIPLMEAINEIGRNVRQGGSRRSAIWAGLNWQHEDIEKYLTVKNWDETFIGNTGYTMAEIRTQDFNYPATLDMTNISVLYDDDWLKDPNKNVDPVFLKNIEQALSTGEPGFGFNFGDKANETLRNAPVSGETLVYEKDAGWVYVDDIIGEEVVVWTGIQWASTVFKKTKSNVETIRIELSNGNYIDCDPEHPFITPNWERIDARDLQQGQELLGLDDEVFVEGVVSTGKIEDVYCCDVGVEEHSFCAEGVIISNCTEVTSEDDSDICNLGSVNIGAIESIEEFKNVVHLASKFLICGSIRADVPFDKVAEIREKNRRIGLGLMGMHEWLLKRGYKYEVTPELHQWLAVYRDESERAANEHCDRFFLSRPKGYRAIAPTGSIGTMASTTTGIEPLFATAFKRRYLVGGDRWHYEYVVDATADQIIRETGCDPEQIETANTLAADPERRVKFQADVQDYVDMGISSTLNLPEWGSEHNNPDKVQEFANIVAKYAHRLRGLTTYPDGSRGGQPIIEVPYKEAIENQGVVFEENQESQCKSGVCGI